MSFNRWRWNLAQRIERRFWKKYLILFPWKSIFEMFGYPVKLDARSAISDKNFIDWKELCSILGLQISTTETFIADIGSGTSGIGYTIRGANVLCFDPSIDFYLHLTFFKKKVFYHCKDKMLCKSIGEELPISSASLDVVFCINVIDHCREPKLVLKEIKRVLRNRGYLVLHTRTWRQPPRVLVDLNHPNILSTSELKTFLKDLKFVVQSEKWVKRPALNDILNRILLAIQGLFFKIESGEAFYILRKS